MTADKQLRDERLAAAVERMRKFAGNLTSDMVLDVADLRLLLSALPVADEKVRERGRHLIDKVRMYHSFAIAASPEFRELLLIGDTLCASARVQPAIIPTHEAADAFALEALDRLDRDVAGLILQPHEAIVADLALIRDALVEGQKDAERLRAGLTDLFALIDEGYLVRDISGDDKPDWAIKQLRQVRRMAVAHAAINAAREAGST